MTRRADDLPAAYVSRPSDLLPELVGRRVLVVGDLMLDRYVEGVPKGLCREAPVPALTVSRRQDMAGGAANTAANVVALGGSATLLGAVGVDEDGDRLRRLLTDAGVDLGPLVVTRRRRTVVKRRIVTAGQILLRLDEGSTDANDDDVGAALADRLTALALGVDAVIVSDYGCGTVAGPVMEALTAVRQRVRLVVVDAKNPVRYRPLRPSMVKPNYAETARILGLSHGAEDGDRASQVLARGDDVLDATGAEMAVVTLDADGAVLFESGRPPFHSYGGAPDSRRSRRAMVGAGDVFTAAVTLALACGADPPVAAEFATIAAATAGERSGTALCERAELNTRLRGDRDRRPLSPETVTAWAEAQRAAGRRIVFTNGCFDLVHEGHVVFLSHARTLGDVLVVGVNDDASVRRLKGQGRPVIDLAGRLRLLSALTCVDNVIPFGEDTSGPLIEKIRPHVFVKGGDYSMDNLPEAGILHRLGVNVHFLASVPERSTTQMIHQIRQF